MKRYLITQPKEFGIYFRGDSIFTQINIKEILTNTMTDPSSVSISLYDPNGTALISDSAMSHTIAGIYEYDYSIPTDACFGVYSIKIETTTLDSLSYFNFVIFPWDVNARVRELSGAFQQNDISDYKLSLLAWNAYKETLMDVFELHSDNKISKQGYCNSQSIYFDGITKEFTLSNYPLADIDGDDVITGHGELTCGEDITFTYLDSTGVKQMGNVTVIDSDRGIVEITTSGGLAIPDDITIPKLTYYSQSTTYDKELMREAVAYLTAHKVMVSFKNIEKATLNDLQSNREKEINRFLIRYQEIIEKIGFPMIGSGK